MKNIKKRLLTGCIAVFTLAFGFGLSSCDLSMLNGGGGEVEAEFKFKLVGNSYTITGRGTNKSGVLEFPSEYRGIPVTAIGAEAFSSEVKLGEIVIPDSITTIEESAFSGCYNLEVVQFGNGLVTIGSQAFANCRGLDDVVFPNSLKTIADKAFYRCESLVNLQFGTGLEKIGTGAFMTCKKLKKVEIPDGAPTVIGSSAFTTDDNTYKRMIIEDVKLGNSVKSVASNAFALNYYLRELVLGDNIQTIGSQAFGSCRRLYKITIGTKVPQCESNSFNDCGAVKEVYDRSGKASGLFPQAWYVRREGEPTRIVVDGDLVYYVGAGIPVPGGGTETGAAVIVSLLTERKDVVIKDTINGQPVIMIADKTFYSDDYVGSLDTGKNCKYIGSEAVRYCLGVAEVILGESVTTIGYRAFHYNSSLAVVHFKSGAKLTNVAADLFNKKALDRGDKLYTKVYFNGTNAEWNTLKEKLETAGGSDHLWQAAEIVCSK